MDITIRKIKKRDIKSITGIIKKIGVDFFNVDLTRKEEAGSKVIKTIIEKYDDVDVEISEFIANITNLSAEQVDDLDLDEFIQLLKDIWAKNNIMGFLKSGS